MKKILILLAALTLAGTAMAAADDFGLYFTPSVNVMALSEDYLRGASVGLELDVDIFGIVPGLKAFVEYDGWFNTVDIPVLFTLGIGRDFYIGVGQTFALADMTVEGLTSTFAMASFPNTIGLGLSIPVIPLADKLALKLNGDLTYTFIESSALDADYGFDTFYAILNGLKLYVGVALEIGLL